MKLSKSLLQAMLVAVTAGAIVSCEKPRVTDVQKPASEKPNVNGTTPTDPIPEGCPFCGMG